MTELIEGCNHECEICSCCDECSFFQNQGSYDYQMYWAAPPKFSTCPPPSIRKILIQSYGEAFYMYI